MAGEKATPPTLAFPSGNPVAIPPRNYSLAQDLNSLLKKFTVKNIDSLPVVADDDPGELIGMLNRREVIAYYNDRVQKMKRAYVKLL